MSFNSFAQTLVLPDWRTIWRTAVVLFKLRVVSLLLMASVGGAFLGARGWPGFGPLLLVLVSGGLAAAGASALNQYIERDRDRQMQRTSRRPLPTGLFLDAEWVPILGANMVVLPAIFVFPFKPMLSFYLLLGGLIYVVIYTLWLKPRTLLNIVIGGAAGSAAVMSGAAAAGQPFDRAALVLALIVFLWTPAHFWSLAILYREDYVRANIPMLPTLMSERNAAWWVMAHTVPTALASLLLALVPALGWIYLVPVALISVDMLRRNVILIRQPNRQTALRFFLSSNVYLLVVLVAVCIAAMLPW